MNEEPLSFLDANCMVGRYKRFREGGFYTAQRLLEEMAHFGISQALVLHALSRENHPSTGNRAILEEVKNHPQLLPVWSALPPRSRELPRPHDFILQAIESGVRAIWLFPGQYSFSLSDWCLGSLLDELEHHRMPVFVDPDIEYTAFLDCDMSYWEYIHNLCSAHPGLTVILSAGRFRQCNRLLYQLLEIYQNLRIEISGYWLYRGIEFICREFGAHRLIFGTRMPIRDPACTIAMVTYAEIPDEQKRLIARDNISTLMKEVVW